MASGQRVVIFRKIPSFPVPSLFPRELNALAKKAKVFWKYFLQTRFSPCNPAAGRKTCSGWQRKAPREVHMAGFRAFDFAGDLCIMALTYKVSRKQIY